LKNKDEVLKEKELDDRSEEIPVAAERDKDADAEGAEKPDTAKNITGPGHTERDAEVEWDRSKEKDEASSSSTHKGSKGAKKTSRKELLELISRKNEMLQRMEREIGEQKQELKIKEDKLLRIVAEFENYKKRTRREWELLEKRAKAELITDILGVLDDFDRALEALGEREDHVADGVILIVTGLKDVLKRAGLREIEVLGQRFDPQFHEAVGGVESEDVEEGFIAHVVQKGYEMNDQLLRPATVIVAKKK
jgi:molecular chaperone GrpE